MPKVLTRLRIDEVSAVDRGAGEGVKILLMKRDDESYWKREFSAGERREAASSGAAESDGSFPIKNASDLHNAMRAIGRSKNPGKTRAHIRARARALGLSGELSDAFKREDTMSKFLELFKSKRTTSSEHVEKATDALAKSVAEIIASDEDLTTKNKVLADTFAEFDDYMQKHVTVSPDPVPDKTKETPMLKELAKALGLKEDASEADITKAVQDRDTQIEILKAGMTDEEKGYHDNIAKNGVTPVTATLQEQFRKLDHDGRKKLVHKQDDLPEYVRKQLEEAADMRKRLEKMEEQNEIAKFETIAREHHYATSMAPKLMKVEKADPEAFKEIIQSHKAAQMALIKAGAFSEFGTTGGNGAVSDLAIDELKAKAAEYRKAHPELSEAQAFAKVFVDPANIELAKRERAESAAPIVNPPGTMR